MRVVKTGLSKTKALKWALIVEVMGFLSIILTCWLTEFFDPPFNLRQVLIETTSIIIFGSITICLSWKLIKWIRYLEGFIVICASCKRIKMEDAQWVPIEKVISSKIDLEFSHGFCPECCEKLYGEYL